MSKHFLITPTLRRFADSCIVLSLHLTTALFSPTVRAEMHNRDCSWPSQKPLLARDSRYYAAICLFANIGALDLRDPAMLRATAKA
jgi:hypothetical protein